MRQNLETFRIPFNRGGLVGESNQEALEPFSMVMPTRNINLQNDRRETRGGTSKVTGYPLSSASQIMGLFDFQNIADNQVILCAAADGKIYKDATNAIKTGMVGNRLVNFCQSYDPASGTIKCFICDGIMMPQVWTGTGNTANISNPAADWSTTPPFQMLVHGRGNSIRIWGINWNSVYASVNGACEQFENRVTYLGSTVSAITAGSLVHCLTKPGWSAYCVSCAPTIITLSRVVTGGTPLVSGEIISDLTNAKSFSISNTGTTLPDSSMFFRITVPGGLVGMVEFGNQLMAFGKNKAFFLDDTSTTTSDWGFSAVQWQGGVAHYNLIAKTENDLICMTEDGEIYSVIATQQYGDYKAASLIRPAYIHTWIRDNIDLNQILKFHCCYDPILRCIKFFMVYKQESKVRMALVYYVDRPPREAWMIHDNSEDIEHGYKASCSARVRGLTGIGLATDGSDTGYFELDDDTLAGPAGFQVYTGDYTGNLWMLEQPSKNDGGEAYQSIFTTPQLTFDNPRQLKKYFQGWMTCKRESNYYIYVFAYIDGKYIFPVTPLSISLLGEPEMEYVDISFPLGNYGKRIQFQFSGALVNESWQAYSMSVDFEPMGDRMQ